MAQAYALRDLQAEYCANAFAPPEFSKDGSPFQSKVHTANAVLCGDFNFEAHEPEYSAVSAPFESGRLWDSWRILNGAVPHPPTFRIHDRTYGPDPVACDFAFVSDGLRDRVKSIAIDGETQVSDHQPMAIELA